MSRNYVQALTQYLAGSGVIVGATSIVLQSLTDIYGNAITSISPAFGDKGFITLEPDTTNEEAATFTGVTVNSNGTVTLTGVSTALAQTPYTETSGLVRAHSGGTKVVITDNVAFWNQFPNKNNVEAIVQNWSVPDPVGMTDIANKEYVLSVVNGGTVSVNGLIVAATADATVAAGDFLYLKSNGRWAKADATQASTSGVAQGAGTSGNAISGGVLLEGVETHQSALAAGSTYYLTNTPGTISTTPGTFSVIVGVGTPTATQLFFSPGLGSLNKALVSTTSVANGIPKANSSGFISDAWLANYLAAETDQSQATTNSTQKVGEANATGKQAILAEKFVPTVPGIKGVKLWKIADTGTYTGTVKVSLQADSAGSPSGSDLASYTISNAAWLKIGVVAGVFTATEFAVTFGTQYTSMTVGGSYWIVVTTSTNDNSNHPNLGANSAGGYASGQLKYFNPTDNWVSVATSILYFKTTEANISQIVGTNTEGLVVSSARPYSLVSLDTTGSTVTNDATETTVFSKMLEGGLLSANSGLKITAYFATINSSASFNGTTTLTVKMKYNGSQLSSCLVGSGVGDSTNGVNTYSTLTIFILNNNSQSSQKIFGFVNITSKDKTATPTLAQFITATTGIELATTSSVDLSQPGMFEITTTLSTATNSSSKYFGSVIEKVAT